MEHSCVQIQISPNSLPSTPSWFGEVAAFAQVLTHTGMLKTIQDGVRFARGRFGTYDLIDFAVVLIGYVHAARTDAVGFLRAASSLGFTVHGFVWSRSVASSFNLVPLSRCSRSAHSGNLANTMRKRICLLASRFLLLVACSIGQASSGWWSMRMEPDKRPDSARCRKRTPCLLLTVGLIRCARRDIKGGSEEK
jgi:hypothetical protein